MGLTIPPRVRRAPAARCSTSLLVVEEIARVCGVTARIVVEGNLGVVGALGAYGTEAQKRRYFPWVLEGDKPAIAHHRARGGLGGHGSRHPRRRGARRVTRSPARSAGSPAPARRGSISCIAAWATRPGAEGIGGRPRRARHARASRSASATARWGSAASRRAACTSTAATCARENVLVGPPDGFKKLMEAYNSQRLGAADGGPRPGPGRLRAGPGLRGRARGSSGGRSATSRGSAGSSPTWRSSSTRPGCSSTAPRPGRAPASRTPLDAAKAKTFAAEMAQEVTSQALQIHGAAGYGRALPLERMVRDARMFAIGGRHRRDDAQPDRRPDLDHPQRLSASR